MKALSIKQPFAELIARGTKKIEYRSWFTHYRGPLIIVASAAPFHEADLTPRERRVLRECTAFGATVALVDLVDITGDIDDFEWHLRNPRRLEARPVKGRVGLYELPDSLVVLVSSTAKCDSTTAPGT